MILCLSNLFKPHPSLLVLRTSKDTPSGAPQEMDAWNPDVSSSRRRKEDVCPSPGRPEVCRKFAYQIIIFKLLSLSTFGTRFILIRIVSGPDPCASRGSPMTMKRSRPSFIPLRLPTYVRRN